MAQAGLRFARTMTIVTHAYRPKRARRRKAQAVAITVPTIVTAKSKRTHQQVPSAATSEPATIVTTAKNPHRHAASATCPI